MAMRNRGSYHLPLLSCTSHTDQKAWMSNQGTLLVGGHVRWKRSVASRANALQSTDRTINDENKCSLARKAVTGRSSVSRSPSPRPLRLPPPPADRRGRYILDEAIAVPVGRRVLTLPFLWVVDILFCFCSVFLRGLVCPRLDVT